MIPHLRIENLKNHTLYPGTYLNSPYMGVPPPDPRRSRFCGLVEEHLNTQPEVLIQFTSSKLSSASRRKTTTLSFYVYWLRGNKQGKKYVD